MSSSVPVTLPGTSLPHTGIRIGDPESAIYRQTQAAAGSATYPATNHQPRARKRPYTGTPHDHNKYPTACFT